MRTPTDEPIVFAAIDEQVIDQPLILNIFNDETLEAYHTHSIFTHTTPAFREAYHLDVNSLGKDYCVSDIHGMGALLKVMLDVLEEHDRLFIAGDLFDRGSDNIQLYHWIKQAKAEGKSVFVIKGNHEQLVFDTFDILKNLSQFDSLDALTKRWGQIGTHFYENGGEWMFKEGGFFMLEDFIEECTRAAKQIGNLSFLQKKLPADFLDQIFHPEIAEICEWINTLPLIYLVTTQEHFNALAGQNHNSPIGFIGEQNLMDTPYHSPQGPVSMMLPANAQRSPSPLQHPAELRSSFIIAHAYMPFSDATLAALIQSNGTLSETVKYDVLWNREYIDFKSYQDAINQGIKSHFPFYVRTQDALPMICGHNTILSKELVTKELNVIRIDCASFKLNCAILFNATEKSIAIVFADKIVSIQNITDLERLTIPGVEEKYVHRVKTRIGELVAYLKKINPQEMCISSKHQSATEGEFKKLIRAPKFVPMAIIDFLYSVNPSVLPTLISMLFDEGKINVELALHLPSVNNEGVFTLKLDMIKSLAIYIYTENEKHQNALKKACFGSFFTFTRKELLMAERLFGILLSTNPVEYASILEAEMSTIKNYYCFPKADNDYIRLMNRFLKSLQEQLIWDHPLIAVKTEFNVLPASFQGKAYSMM